MDTEPDFDPVDPSSNDAPSQDGDTGSRGDEARLRAVPNITPRSESPDERHREILAELKGDPIARATDERHRDIWAELKGDPIARATVDDAEVAPPKVAKATARANRRRTIVLVGILAVVALVAFAAARAISGNSDTSGHAVGVDDDFNVNRASLEGESAGGAPAWTLDGGTFAIQDGSVTATATNPDSAFALVRFKSAPSRISALISSAGADSGVVFRYVDRDNYWTLQAAPGYGTWNVYRVVNGKQTFIKNTANNFTEDTTIEVRITPQQIQVSINDRPTALITDSALSEGSAVGLLAGPTENHTTLWTRFVAVP